MVKLIWMRIFVLLWSQWISSAQYSIVKGDDKKKPSFLFSGIISGLGLTYWKDYCVQIIICFYWGQKEIFEYKNFSDRFLGAEQ